MGSQQQQHIHEDTVKDYVQHYKELSQMADTWAPTTEIIVAWRQNADYANYPRANYNCVEWCWTLAWRMFGMGLILQLFSLIYLEWPNNTNTCWWIKTPLTCTPIHHSRAEFSADCPNSVFGLNAPVPNVHRAPPGQIMKRYRSFRIYGSHT